MIPEYYCRYWTKCPIPHPHCCIGKMSKIFWKPVKIRGKYSIGGYPKVLGNLIPKFFGVKYHCKGIAYSTILCSSTNKIMYTGGERK